MLIKFNVSVINVDQGALVRTVIRLLDLSVPYTVVLMLSGLVLGAFTRIEMICPFWSSYTKIARMPPKIILYIFLPALVYESAFNMKVHVFLRSAYQVCFNNNGVPNSNFLASVRLIRYKRLVSLICL